MRVTLFLVLAACCGCASAASTYAVTSASSNYAFIINVNYMTLANDELSAPVFPPGFSFTYFGQTFTGFRVGTNGAIQLCNGGAGSSHSKTPDHAGGCWLAPLWLDLLVSPSAGSIGWLWQGGELVVEWYYVNQFFGAAVQPIPVPGVRMQIRLKPSGAIEFCYGDQNPMVSPQFKPDPHAVAISDPSGNIIDGVDSGFVNAQGVMTTWPTDRAITFTPVTTNAPPALAITSGGVPVSNGATLHVAHNSTLAQLMLEISISDADGDSVALNGTVSNAAFTGMTDAEFSSAPAPAPWSIRPSAGLFFKENTTHQVVLAANDGKGGTAQFSFSIVVGAASGGSANGGIVRGGGGGACTAAGAGGASWVLMCLAPLALWRRRKP